MIKRYAGIGSRETPHEAYRVQRAMAWLLAEFGYDANSGGCPKGGDDATYKGIYNKRNVDLSRQRIYISYEGMEGFTHDPSRGIYCPEDHFENYAQAAEIALAARGSWNGLYAKGIKHHTRNAYQILGDDLNTPVDFVLCWAQPVGKKGYVKGGTGTAVKIAIDRGIPVYNLYYEDVFRRCEYLCINAKSHYTGRTA